MFACKHLLDRQPGLLLNQPRSAGGVFDLAGVASLWNQLALLLPLAHPYYWAAFTVNGM
jgi:hypothetical protein